MKNSVMYFLILVSRKVADLMKADQLDPIRKGNCEEQEGTWGLIIYIRNILAQNVSQVKISRRVRH